MAAAASLTDLQAEASCPLCLDFLRDPVTTDCGHNFCGSCITQCWEALQDVFPCPLCLYHCPNGNFTRNPQLGHMTELVKQLAPRRSKRKCQEEKVLCKKHSQVLALFCEKDLELLCAKCSVSSDHWDHHLMPLEQAASHQRKKLKSSLEYLKKNIEGAEKGQKTQFLKSFELKGRVEMWRRGLNSEYEQLKCFLGKEQEATLNSLRSIEKNAEDNLTENKRQVLNYVSALKNLLSEITEKFVQADVDLLLTGIESTHNKNESLKTPGVFSYELQKESFHLPLQYFGLHKMMSMFKVDLTLDPKTAHPNLIILEDSKTAIFGVMEPNSLHKSKAFAFYQAVCSSEGFHAGRHFWQVEVRGTGELALGVCKESFPRHGVIAPSPSNGCWKIHLWSTAHGTSDSENCRRIGIFLDYELGEMSFYNLNNRSYLFTCTGMFTEKLVPYFSVRLPTNCLTITLVTEE